MSSVQAGSRLPITAEASTQKYEKDISSSLMLSGVMNSYAYSKISYTHATVKHMDKKY